MAVFLLAAVAVSLAAIAAPLKLLVLLYLAAHLYRQWRRICILHTPHLQGGLKHTAQGWQLWSAQHGWRAGQLRADSMALPALVLLRYRYAHQWFYRSALIAFDSMPQDSHRRLRVRLKFSRQRWQAVK